MRQLATVGIDFHYVITTGAERSRIIRCTLSVGGSDERTILSLADMSVELDCLPEDHPDGSVISIDQ